MVSPPTHTEAELAAGRDKAEEEFRTKRLTEDAAIYHELFDSFQDDVANLLELTVDLTQLEQNGLEALGTKRYFYVARYLTGPPTSTDDLKVVAKVNSFVKTRLQNNPKAVEHVIRIIRETIDRRRFAWLREDREASEVERNQAVIATAALMAMQRVATHRRTKAKEEQELAVEQALIAAGLEKVPPRSIQTFDDAPKPGQFCRESELGPSDTARKADVVVRLFDSRVMPIECKVSNSSTNSIKRLNNDAAVKAVYWQRQFGESQIVSAAVLSGVYKLRNLTAAQDKSLCIFWEHDLQTMVAWINSTQPQARPRR